MTGFDAEWTRFRAESAQSQSNGLPLFDVPQVRPLARRSDPDTSKAAAVRVGDQLNRLQSAVLSAYSNHGPMTAKLAERLPEFADYGYSTVRKRTSELWRRGLLRDTGQQDAGCIVYEVVRSSATTLEAA